MITIALYDINISNAMSIRNEIENCSKKIGLQYSITVYTNQDELLLDHHKYSAVFISTDFKGNDAADIAKSIRLDSHEIKLIFISDNERAVHKIIRHQPFAFIRKSFMEIDLSETLSLLFYETNAKGKLFTFKTENSTVNLNVNDINYFETFGHVIEINIDNQIIPVRTSLKTLENQFSGYGFVRIHKSYLVNYRYVFAVSRQNITLSNMKKLPIGKGKANEIRTKLKGYLNNQCTISV